MTPLDELVRPTLRAATPQRKLANACILFMAAAPPALMLGSCLSGLGVGLEGAIALCVTALLLIHGVRWMAENTQLSSEAQLAEAARGEIAAQLLQLGFEEDAEGAEVEAARQQLWEARQREELESLRRRASAASPPMDLVDMLRTAGRAQRLAAAAVLMFGLCLVVFGYFISGLVPPDPDEAASSPILGSLICTLISVMGSVSTLALPRWRAQLRIIEEQRELTREVRRVEALIDAAGGLTLAEDEQRDLLQGAIEHAGAVGGEVELIAPGPRVL